MRIRSVSTRTTPLKGNPIYIPPKGFIEVTKDNEDTKVSPNFRIKEFLTKQKSGYPKYLVLDERLIYLLEAIGTHLEPRGWDVGRHLHHERLSDALLQQAARRHEVQPASVGTRGRHFSR